MPTTLLFLLLLLHLLGCFSAARCHRRRHQSLFKKKPTKTLFSFLKSVFIPTHYHPHHPHISHPIPPSIPSPSSSTRSLRVAPLSPDHSAGDSFYAPNIHPCSLCGEILPTPTLLDHHRATKHCVSDLFDGGDILRIIFKTGWPDAAVAKSPTLHRILKIHHTPAALSRFEEYREVIKSRAAAGDRRNERCAADGNELLRFYCTTFICSLDGGGACGHPYCGACGIVRSGFYRKGDGIATQATSWMAHAAVPEELEEEFSFMKIKRALMVCRVIAGRVGSGPGREESGFDSVESGAGGELVVFNPRAVLPCFVIVYAV